MIRPADFPVTLIFPPQGHFTQPYLALPCLQAYLRQHGFEDTELIDANVEAYDRFLGGEYLERCAERVRDSLPTADFEERAQLGFGDLERYRAAVESAVSARHLPADVERAKAVVRGPECFDPERYLPAIRTLYHGLRLVSAAHFPSQLTPHNFTMRYANDRSAQVFAALGDEHENPFVEHFRSTLLPRLVARRPRLVGLSIIYGSQLIPALTLGRMLKAALPECHVTAGGGFLAYIGEKLFAAPRTAQCLDSMVFHEGEAPLLALAQALRSQSSLESVGSLLWFDRERPEGGARRNAPAHPIKLEDAPLPDFEGLPLPLYFSPQIVLPYDINRGCYYGECSFCTLPTVIGPGYRTRSASRITDQVLELAERHGTRNFNFITDCMPPGMIRDLPDQLLARRADIHWWADARVEPKAYDAEGARKLYASGCRKLLFGFETATPRLLKLMQKGQSLKSTLQVARHCAEAGISVTFYAMVGFPSETRSEARATLDFLVRNADVVREVSLQTFHIDEVAQTYREPERFGIRILDDPQADLQLYHDYVPAEGSDLSGMTQTEAAEMFGEMMAGLRAALPLFAGDNVYYFMQKSHYFLHLARGTTPDQFAAACRARAEERAGRGADRALTVPAALELLETPFRYAAVVERLARPAARAVRPDFTTGRYVEGAREAAAASIEPVPAEPAVLAYSGGGSSEFVGLSRDAARVVAALRAAGDYGTLREQCADQGPTALDRLDTFVAELHRLGLLTRPRRAEPAPRRRASAPGPESTPERTSR
jgi:anaerobic magnesium-protoporphyrin IX monomethyl ester cyclase